MLTSIDKLCFKTHLSTPFRCGNTAARSMRERESRTQRKALHIMRVNVNT